MNHLTLAEWSSQAGAHVKRWFMYMCYLPDWLQSLAHKEMMKLRLQDEAWHPCLHYSMLHPSIVMLQNTQNLVTPLGVSLFIMHWLWKTIEILFQFYCILPVHFEDRLSALFSWLLPPQRPCLFSWLPPLLFLASANDNKLLICPQMTFTAESRKLHQRKW